MNNAYLISPEATVNSPTATAFAVAVYRTLQDFLPVVELRTASQLLASEPQAGDAVIVFNREDANYSEPVAQFLRRTAAAGAKILPVASSIASRRPPDTAGTSQSFDLHDQLRQRALTESQSDTVAMVFARQLLSVMNPTLVSEPMSLFLSHRRLDGEDLTAAFTRRRTTTTDRAFRDLFDIKVGEDAQEVIDARLRESDAVVFLDTPKSGESPWIAKELRGALELGLPIVWVQIGAATGRTDLQVKPAERPHFTLPDLDPCTQEISVEDIEKIVHETLVIHRRDYVDRLLSEFSRLRDFAIENGIELSPIEPRKMLYRLTLPRPQNRYAQRPLTHLLQLFGRTPTSRDIGEFPSCACAIGYEAHPKHGHHYDSAILLAATPPRTTATWNAAGVHTDSITDYVAEIERVTKPLSPVPKRIVISGAFPDCEPAFQQNITAAVHAVAETALRSGLRLSFGAHPTFQFLLFDLAKRLRPDDFRLALRMYISKYFATEGMILEAQRSADVIATNVVADDRAQSLTLMRSSMLSDPEAAALVVIGGKTSKGGHRPGIDEEIAIAQKRGLPIFIFGSVGGRSSEIVAGLSAKDRIALNGQTEEINELFVRDIDYSRLMQIIVGIVRDN